MKTTVIDMLEDYSPERRVNKPAQQLIITAISNGFHSLGQLKRETNLPGETLLLELENLEGYEIVKKPGPPLTTYWPVGQVPDRIYLAGNKVKAVPVKKGKSR